MGSDEIIDRLVKQKGSARELQWREENWDIVLTDQHGNQARGYQQPPEGFSEPAVPVTRLQVVRQGGIIGVQSLE